MGPFLLGIVGSLACSSDPVLEWPDITGAKVAIIVTDDPPQIAVQSIEAPLHFEEAARVELLLYAEDLAALGLDPGPVAGPPTCRACALSTPGPTYALQSSALDGAAGVEAWTRLSAPSDWALDRLVPDRAARCTPCAPLEPEWVPIEIADGNARLRVLPWSKTEALVHGFPAARLFIVDEAAGLRELCRSERFMLGGASFRDVHDRIWLATTDGRLVALDAARLAFDQPCEVATATVSSPNPADASTLLWLAGGETESGTELYGLASTGSIVRYLNGRWDLIDARVPELDLSQRLDWLGPGTALALSGRTDAFLVERGTELTPFSLSDARGLLLSVSGMTVRAIPGLGTVIGSRDDLLWRLENLELVPLEDDIPDSSDRVEALSPDRDGVFFTVRNGGYRRWLPGIGYCERHDLMADGAFKTIQALENDRWVVGGPSLYVLRPNAAIRGCAE